MICQKCKKENIEWKIGVTYEGLDEHHNPPQYMFEKNEIWKGELYFLCRECHTGKEGLHNTIILPHLQKNSNLLRRNNSEDWIWKYHIRISERVRIRDEIFERTKKWIKKDDDTDSNKIAE